MGWSETVLYPLSGTYTVGLVLLPLHLVLSSEDMSSACVLSIDEYLGMFLQVLRKSVSEPGKVVSRLFERSRSQLQQLCCQENKAMLEIGF